MKSEMSKGNQATKGKTVVPPSTKEIEGYIDERSDFGFELQVLKELVVNKFKCSHGRPYRDSVTGKSREFDIVASKVKGEKAIHLAVEVKNTHLPLVVFCRNRRKEESFNEVISLKVPKLWGHKAIKERKVSSGEGNFVVRIGENFSYYSVGEMVGKKVEQFKLNMSQGNGFVDHAGKDAFEKIEQVLHSAETLVGQIQRGQSAETYHAVLPIVVVPNGMLTAVSYDDDGNRSSAVASTTSVSMTVDHVCSVDHGDGYVISHLEIVTFDGLVPRLKDLLNEPTDDDCTPLFNGVGDRRGGTWI